MDPKLRDYFDILLESVLAELPKRMLELLDATPLHVEDYPSDEILARVGVEHREHLCGLYTGVPITEQGSAGGWSGMADPNAVTIYREGIMNLASSETGRLTEPELIRQIRITILHELGHHHGLDEDDLDELGYG